MMSRITQQSQGLGPPGMPPVYLVGIARDRAPQPQVSPPGTDGVHSQALPAPHFIATPRAKALISLALLRSARGQSSQGGGAGRITSRART